MKEEKVIKAEEGEKTGGKMTKNGINNIREEFFERLERELIMLDIYPCDYNVREEFAGFEITDCDEKTIYEKLQGVLRIYIWRLRNEIADLKEELAAIKKRGQKD